MLIWLTQYLQHYYRALGVFQYTTLRAILGAVTALLIALWLGPRMINWLTQYKVGQVVRDDGPKTHFSKTGTPTMGGLLILIAITISTLLWGDLSNGYLWIVLFVTIGFGAIGAIDDYRKLTHKNPKGLSARSKYFWQSLIGISVAFVLYFMAKTPQETNLLLPFF